MAHRSFLHIGAPKSGTTYVQSLLWANRGLLRERGLLFPGARPFEQNRASIEVRNGRHLDPGHDGVWTRFMRRAADFGGDLVLSNEWYVLAGGREREAAVADLAAHTEVHLVFTARDLVGQIPAAWQESLKLGSGLSLRQFVSALDEPDQQWRWGTLDAAEALAPWSEVVPPERIHVVVVPRSSADPSLLWRRFLGVLGVSAEGTDTTSSVANESLGVESARLLQEFGPSLREALDPDQSPWQVPYEYLRNDIAHRILVPLGGERIGVPEDLVSLLRERSQTMVGRLAAAGYDLVGEVADLLDGSPRLGSVVPDEVPAEVLLERAKQLSAALLAELKQERTR